jgi:hypothetical protein
VGYEFGTGMNQTVCIKDDDLRIAYISRGPAITYVANVGQSYAFQSTEYGKPVYAGFITEKTSGDTDLQVGNEHGQKVELVVALQQYFQITSYISDCTKLLKHPRTGQPLRREMLKSTEEAFAQLLDRAAEATDPKFRRNRLESPALIPFTLWPT